MKLFKLLFILCAVVCCSGSYGEEIKSHNEYLYSLENNEFHMKMYEETVGKIPNGSQRSYAIDILIAVCERSVYPDKCMKALGILTTAYSETCNATKEVIAMKIEADRREKYLLKLLETGKRL